MKTRGCILVLALILAPLMARAQSNPSSETVASGGAPMEVIVAQQSQSEVQPPGAALPDRKQVEGRVVATPRPTTEGPTVVRKFGPGLGAWWKDSGIVSRLNLSQEQVNKISKTYLDHKLKLIDLQADLEKQELRLEPLMDVDQPDESRVGAQIDLITAARGRLEKENAIMMLDIRRWLSVEQWKKLQALHTFENGRMYVRTGPPGIEGPEPPQPPGDLPVTGIPAVRKPQP